jgi:hypothetical protein
MRDAGLSQNAADAILAFNNGVTADYIQALRKAGYALSFMDVVRLKNNDVPADYAAALAAPGRPAPSVMQLIAFRQRGLDVQAARKKLQ